MRIALFNIDSLASNTAVRSFIERRGDEIVFVGLSPPFRRSRGHQLVQRWRHIKRSGMGFSSFLAWNFQIPRHIGRVSPSSSTLAGLCHARNIKVEQIEDVNAAEVRQRLAELKVDLIVSCYFDQIFHKEIIELPKHGILNVHSSMLPEHRGPMPVVYGCIDEPPLLGVTVHAVDDGIDTGAIFAQERYEQPSGRSVLSMMSDLHELGVELLDEVIEDLVQGRAPVAIKSQAGGSYAGFPDHIRMRRFHESGQYLYDRHDMVRAWRTPMSI